METDIVVVRPSGVWNSRSPLNDYVYSIRQISRTQAITSAISIGFKDFLQNNADPQRSARTYFRKDKVFRKQGLDNHVRNYFKSYGMKKDGTPLQSISVEDFCEDTYLAIRGATLLATVAINSLIECYIQCWFLNTMLARLEGGETLNSRERKLIGRLNPAKTRIPANLSNIIEDYNPLKRRLEALPPYFTHPVSRETVYKAESKDLSAFRELKFWQSYRNQIIHGDGLASPKFYDEWNDHYERKRDIYPHLPKMQQSRPLPVHDDMFGTQAACFYKIAKSLNENLEDLSDFRRGHVNAPGPTVELEGDFRSPPLLLEGDHSPSLEWTTNADFRIETARSRGWKFL